MKTANIVYSFAENSSFQAEWYEKADRPCWVKEFDFAIVASRYPVKVIDYDIYSRELLCCRVDEYPLIWLWWSFVWKTKKTLHLLEAIAEVWGSSFKRPNP